MTTKKTEANNILFIEKLKGDKGIEFIVHTTAKDKVDIRFVRIEHEPMLLMTATVHLDSSRTIHFTFRLNKAGENEIVPTKEESYGEWLEGLLVKFFYHKEILEDKDMILLDEEFKIMKSLGI